MEEHFYPVPTAYIKTANVSKEKYIEYYQRSTEDPEKFWGELAAHFITFAKPWDRVLSGSFEHLDVRWFQGAALNACYNCLDRHLPKRANQTAIIWEGDDPRESQNLTYQSLYESVCRFANVLKKNGVRKGDRVCIYLPMIPEAAIAMLACARIGAIHSVVFAGFSAESLKTRIIDAKCSMVITANVGIRDKKIIPLKKNVDIALKDCAYAKQVIVVKRTEDEVPWDNTRDTWYHDAIREVEAYCP